MQSIGRIVRLQVQTSSLKVGSSPKRYDPAALHAVSEVRVTPSGVIGIADDGADLLDVHNSEHPDSKNRGGENGLSIGFTGHYDLMRDRFGQHLDDGIAGENILVATDRLVTEEELDEGVVILGKDGVALPLHTVFPAAPCVEFTRFALRWPDDLRPDRRVTEGLQFLDGGMRGYYASYAGPPAIIAVGDEVALL